MVATVTAIAEKKKCSAIAAIIWKPLSSNCSDRSDNDRWDTTSSMSANVVAAISGKWFPYYRGGRWTFFSQRSKRSYGNQA